MSQRTQIGRYSTLAARQVVYRIGNGLEVDELDHFEIIRRRVFFDDVVMVTYHRQPPWGTAVFMAVLLLLFGILAAAMASTEPAVAITCASIAGVALLYGVVRLILQVDVVTVFGRRSKAAMRFRFRKALARRTYEEICAEVAAAQERLAREIAVNEPPPEPVEELPPMPAAE